MAVSSTGGVTPSLPEVSAVYTSTDEFVRPPVLTSLSPERYLPVPVTTGTAVKDAGNVQVAAEDAAD